MKNLLFYTMMILSIGAWAQQQGTDTTDFVILSSDLEFLDPIIETGASDVRNGHFRVVFFGRQVAGLTKPEMRDFIDRASKHKIELAVCEMSINRLGIDRDAIPKEIEIIGNAFLHSLQLQQQGYKALHL